MRYLNRFKTFENVSINDWGVLLDVLQSDIFDEWNIHKIKDEIFDGNENDPDYKVWAFRKARSSKKDRCFIRFNRAGSCRWYTSKHGIKSI